MNIPGLVVIFILLVSLGGPLSFSLYLLFILPVFGSMALLPPELAGGSSLTPGSFAALFFVAKAIANRSVFQDAMRSLTNFRRFGFLGLFLVYAVLGAYALPRIFEGTVHVYSMRTGDYMFVGPSITNYTQAAYLILSTLTAVVISVLIRNDKFMNAILKAILAGAWAVILTGILDVVAAKVGLESILSYFRTANYVFMTGNYIAGIRRIIGLMPEASAYGAMAVSFCALLLFLRPIYPPRLWRWRVPVAAWGCGLMAMLSTSSTAYAMMIVLLGLYAFYNVHRITPEGQIVRKTVSAKIMAIIGMGMLALLVLIFDKDLADHFYNLIDTLLFKKQNSTSYNERTGLTLAAFDTFFESSGFGVGVGSVLTSNFFVNVLASTGVIGAALFLAFLWTVFTRRAPESEARDYVMLRAAKLSLLPVFMGAAVAGTTPDFGPFVGTIFGFIIGLSQPLRNTRRTPPRLRKEESGKEKKPGTAHSPKRDFRKP